MIEIKKERGFLTTMRLRNIKGATSAVIESNYCIQNASEYKGNWNTLFENNHPIHIEIGMGKGQFIIALAQQNPSINYIGIEMYTSVLYRALQKLEDLNLPNLRFICENAVILPEVFSEGEISRIYLNFSDPWPKDRHAKRRLTSKEFLARYESFLAKNGHIEFKTDNVSLFDFSLEEAKASNWNLRAFTYDLHHDSLLNEGNVMTEYEKKFSAKGQAICKMVIDR